MSLAKRATRGHHALQASSAKVKFHDGTEPVDAKTFRYLCGCSSKQKQRDKAEEEADCGSVKTLTYPYSKPKKAK
jgi:hypothetical protein